MSARRYERTGNCEVRTVTRTLAILSLLLVASCAGRPAFAAPDPALARCHDLQWFVEGMQRNHWQHVVLRGSSLETLMNFLDGTPGLDIMTIDPESAIVTTDPGETRAAIALVKNGQICDRINAPMEVARQFMAGA